jgi:hypothetical protein
MESVAIATTSRTLPIRFPPAAPRRRRVAAAAKRACSRPHKFSAPTVARLRQCSRPRLCAGRDDEGEDEAARGSRTSSAGGGGREPAGLAPFGLSVSPFSKVRALLPPDLIPARRDPTRPAPIRSRFARSHVDGR